MKRVLRVFLAFALGVALSACREPADPPNIEPPFEPTEEETEDSEYQDVDIDHENEVIDALEIDPYWGNELERNTGQVFETVLGVCVEIDQGESINNVVLDMMNAGVPRLSAEHMVETAVFIVCPEFESNYESYVSSNR